MSTIQSAFVADPQKNQQSTGHSIPGSSYTAPNNITVPTATDVWGLPIRTAPTANMVNANALIENMSRMRMAHLNPQSPSVANPYMGSYNTAYAALPATTSTMYPVPSNIFNAFAQSNVLPVQTTGPATSSTIYPVSNYISNTPTQFNNPAVQTTAPATSSTIYPVPNSNFNAPTQSIIPAVQTTGPATSSKPKKISKRPKLTDKALQEECAAPEVNQKRVCALKLTYHRGAEPNDANSLTLHMTELLGYKPTANVYEKKPVEIKADGSKFAMPNLDKPLCQGVVCKSLIPPPPPYFRH